MMATSISYVIIQMPGLIFFNSSPEIQARRESGFALVTLLLCVSSFIAYLVYQRMISGDNEVEERLREDAMIDAINQVRTNQFTNHFPEHYFLEISHMFIRMVTPTPPIFGLRYLLVIYITCLFGYELFTLPSSRPPPSSILSHATVEYSSTNFFFPFLFLQIFFPYPLRRAKLVF